MTIRKLGILLAAAALGACICCGCGKKEQEDQGTSLSVASEPENEAMTGETVGISFPDESDPRWTADAVELTALLKSHGYDTKVLYCGGSAEQQSRDIDSMIASDCRLLIISAADTGGLTSVMQRVKEAGIPVIAYDRLIRNTDAVTDYVGSDDYSVGVMQAKYILDRLGLKEAETSKVYSIEFAAGDKADPGQGYYFNGAYDTLKPYFDSGALQIPSGETMFADAVCDVAAANEGADKNAQEKTVQDLAADRMKRILQRSYPNAEQLDAVLCTDDAAAAGVIKAVGSSYSGKNQVVITGMGGGDQALSLIRDGKQSMTVVKPPERLHKITALLAVSILRGESPDSVLIEKANLGDDIRYDTESYDNGMGVVEAYAARPETVTSKTLEGES